MLCGHDRTNEPANVAMVRPVYERGSNGMMFMFGSDPVLWVDAARASTKDRTPTPKCNGKHVLDEAATRSEAERARG